MLGEALHERSVHRAEKVLLAAPTTSDDTTLTVHLTEIRSRNLMGAADVDGALAVNAQARPPCRNRRRGRADLERRMLLTSPGSPRDALRCPGTVGELTGAFPGGGGWRRYRRSLGSVAAETAAERAAEPSPNTASYRIRSPFSRRVHLITRITPDRGGRLTKRRAWPNRRTTVTPATAPPDALMVGPTARRVAPGRDARHGAALAARGPGPLRAVERRTAPVRPSALATAEAHLGDVAAAR